MATTYNNFSPIYFRCTGGKQIFHIEEAGSTVMFDIEGAPRMYIQSHDTYGYQRELIMNLTDGLWLVRAGQHPYWKEQFYLSRRVGWAVINQFIETCNRGGGLLFNADNAAPVRRAKNAGFTRLHTSILFTRQINLSLF